MLRRLLMAQPAGGGGSDPYWSNVVSLLHLDASDGSTTITDETGRAWTANGSAQIDAAESQFGGSSLLLPGGDADNISTASSSAFEFGSDDFTFEFFGNIDSLSPGLQVVASMRNVASGIYDNVIAIESGYLAWSNGAAWIRGGSTVPVGTMQHFAVVMDSGTLRIFHHGVLNYSQYIGHTINGARPCVIGGFDGGSPRYPLAGHLDEIRITKGVARYIAAFTPPSMPLPIS